MHEHALCLLERLVDEPEYFLGRLVLAVEEDLQGVGVSIWLESART